MKIRSISLLASSIVMLGSHAQAADDIAWDMVGSTSMGLITHDNPFAGAFSSSGDGSEKYRRAVSGSIPFAVLDDSLVTFPADTLGIIDDNNTNEFFGVTDTNNGDNPSGDVTASWTFDVAGEVDLAVAIDIGAMGDFETADTFAWYASLDGGAEQLLFATSTDEAGVQNYTLAGGASISLDDPLLIDTVVLDNQLRTFTAAVTGTGTTLTVRFEGNTDGGSEALAFQNLVVLANHEGDEPPDLDPEPELSFIHEVQGSADSSPLQGVELIIEGIVTGDFQDGGGPDSGDLNGFYVQEEDSDADGDASTSEGIFVYDPSTLVDVQPGDKVRVTGVVSEFSGLTEITAAEVSILASGQPLPLATAFTLPLATVQEQEAMEGMLVVLPQALVISEYFNYDRFGELVLALPLPGEERPMTPTAVEEPGSAGYETRRDTNLLSRITLDDGLTEQNPDQLRHPDGTAFSLSNRFRGGDLVSDTTGILDYRFSLWRIQPVSGASHTPFNSRPEQPPFVGGDLKVASFNVLNYFTTLDEGDDICGPDFNLECRGADNEEELTRQHDKIVAALAAIDADIFGLIEIENNDAALDNLAAGLNAVVGADVYAPVVTGPIGTDAIKVAFLYKTATVAPVGDFAVLDSSVDPDFIDTKNRPALAQTFEQGSNGSRLTVVVNHFKSKGSDCLDIGDPDLEDGQGNCNLTRLAAAEALVDWLATDPTGSGAGGTLILGDLNAYDHEDPIAVLTDAGYTDLEGRFGGEFAYSYVFDGQFGYLDYALANESLMPQVTGAAAWHINADEPDILDYDTSFKPPAQQALYTPDAFRSSDHDPVIVGLNLTPPLICDAAYASREVLWPPNHGFVPVSIKGISGADGEQIQIEVTAVYQDEPRVSRGDNTWFDALKLPGGKILLRADRSVTRFSNGRFYHVRFEASAGSSSCSGEVLVSVPRSRNREAVDDGALYPSFPWFWR